ncbi:MAG TPA: hypothetical protein VIM84_07695 [Gemmatimonadales bacterium]
MFDQLQEELARCPVVEGLTLVDTLLIPEALRPVILLMIRHGPLSVPAFATTLGLTEDEAQRLGEGMVQKGWISVKPAPDGALQYHVRFIPRPRLPNKLLESLEND